MVRTLTALGPLSPGWASYSTRAPSERERKPSPAISVWWTKRSLPGSSGVTKPKPLSSLNHFTVPVAMGTSHVGVPAYAEVPFEQRLRPLALHFPAHCRPDQTGTLASFEWNRARPAPRMT